MDANEISTIIAETINTHGVQSVDLAHVSGMLTMELAAHGDDMPQSTRNTIMAALVVLQSHALRDAITDAAAQATVAKARGKLPIAEVLGQRIYIADAMFDVQVTHDIDADQWVAVCDEIGVATEAPTIEEVQARFFEIAPEIMLENGNIRPGQNAAFTFVNKATA